MNRMYDYSNWTTVNMGVWEARSRPHDLTTPKETPSICMTIARTPSAPPRPLSEITTSFARAQCLRLQPSGPFFGSPCALCALRGAEIPDAAGGGFPFSLVLCVCASESSGLKMLHDQNYHQELAAESSTGENLSSACRTRQIRATSAMFARMWWARPRH